MTTDDKLAKNVISGGPLSQARARQARKEKARKGEGARLGTGAGARASRPIVVYTIGHSNRSLDEFVNLLLANGIGCLVDVRKKPTSSGWPHFSFYLLLRELTLRHIVYFWLPSLGGRRSEGLGNGSPNKAWKSTMFRNYADHMQTDEFAKGVGALVAAARERPTAMMSSKVKWHRCHRRLIADHLVVHGIKVVHIVDDSCCEEHKLCSFACVDGRCVTYPAQGAEVS